MKSKKSDKTLEQATQPIQSAKQKKQATHIVPAKGTQTLKNVSDQAAVKPNKKRKLNTDITEDACMNILVKKVKLKDSSANIEFDEKEIQGFEWSNNSYAYDSLYSILYNVYRSQNILWRTEIANLNSNLQLFSELFADVADSSITMETARDTLREALHIQDKQTFPLRGYTGTDIFALTHEMLRQDNFYDQQRCCEKCDIIQSEARDRTIYKDFMLIQCLKTVWTKAPRTVRDPQKHTAIEWLTAYLKQRSNQKCVTCNSKMINKLVFNDTPLFLAFYAKDVDIAWNASINFAQQKYRLCGIIYYGSFHFTSRIITTHGDIWYNDGMVTKEKCSYEGNIRNASIEMLNIASDGKHCLLSLYVLI